MKKMLVSIVAGAVLGLVAGFCISVALLFIGERVEAIAGLHFGVPWPEITMMGYIGIYAPMLGAVAGTVGAIIGRPLIGGAMGVIASGLTDLILTSIFGNPGNSLFLFVVALFVGAGTGALGAYIRKTS